MAEDIPCENKQAFCELALHHIWRNTVWRQLPVTLEAAELHSPESAETFMGQYEDTI